jgi:hypothetical protein
MDEIRLSASTPGDGLPPSTSATIENAHADAKGVVIGDNASQTNDFG